MNYIYNFYQSQLRKDVNSSVFAKPCFEISHAGRSYQVIVKDKSIFWVIVVRYQVLGINHPLDASWIKNIRKLILDKIAEYYPHKRIISLYIQFGFTEQLSQYTIADYKLNSEVHVKNTYNNLKVFEKYVNRLGLKPSVKHNLPDATIVINVAKSTEDLREVISKNTKEKIKKAENQLKNSDGKLIFELSSQLSDYELFYQLYTTTGETKWFGAVRKWAREKLVTDSLKEGYGKLFVVKSLSNWVVTIVSAAFCLQDKDVLIYLYGWNDRSYGNKWFSQLLHRNIIQYAHDADLKWYDMLWASRIGKEHDRLANVTQFKMGFGGQKIEYAGSFDYIINNIGSWIYKAFN